MDFLKEANKCITDEAEGVVGVTPEVMNHHICDRACKNRPCECKKLSIFSVFDVS